MRNLPHLFAEIAEDAFWSGEKPLEFGRPMKPGEFFEKLPPEIKEELKNLTAADLNKTRLDEILWMIRPNYVYEKYYRRLAKNTGG